MEPRAGRSVARAFAQSAAATPLPGPERVAALPPGNPGRSAPPRALLSIKGEAGVVRPCGTDFEVVARVGLRQWRELASPPATR